MGRSIATLAFLAGVLPLAACDGGGSGAPGAGKPDLSDTGLAHRIATLETRAASLELRAGDANGRIDVVEGTADAVQGSLDGTETRINATKGELLEGIDAIDIQLETAVKAGERVRIVRGTVDGGWDGAQAGEGFSAWGEANWLGLPVWGVVHVAFDVPFAEPPTIVCSSTDDNVVSVTWRSETEFQVYLLHLHTESQDSGGPVSVGGSDWDFIAIGHPQP